MSVFVHAQVIKTVHARGGEGRKWQNSVHVVVECPPMVASPAKNWRCKYYNMVKVMRVG